MPKDEEKRRVWGATAARLKIARRFIAGTDRRGPSPGRSAGCRRSAFSRPVGVGAVFCNGQHQLETAAPWQNFRPTGLRAHLDPVLDLPAPGSVVVPPPPVAAVCDRRNVPPYQLPPHYSPLRSPSPPTTGGGGRGKGRLHFPHWMLGPQLRTVSRAPPASSPALLPSRPPGPPFILSFGT